MNGRGRLCSFYSLQHSVANYYKRPLSLYRVEILHLIDLYCATHPYTVGIWAKNRAAVVLSSLSPPPMFILSLPVSQTEWLVCCGTHSSSMVYLWLLCDSQNLSFSLLHIGITETDTRTQIKATCHFISAILWYQSAALCWMQRKAAESRSEQFEGVGGEKGRGR